MNVSRWLKGYVFASPHRGFVRVQIEALYGQYRCETYITRKQARELRDRLNEILAEPVDG
jgi:hypothetical protein